MNEYTEHCEQLREMFPTFSPNSAPSTHLFPAGSFPPDWKGKKVPFWAVNLSAVAKSESSPLLFPGY